MLDRGGRQRHDIMARLQHHPHVDELSRPQGIALVGEGRLQAYRAGGLIDFVVDQRQGTAVELCPVIARQRRHGHRPARQRLVDLQYHVLGQGEHDRDRLNLRHHDDAGGIGRVHDVARVHQADAGAPGKWRGDAGVLKLCARVVDQPAVDLQLRLQLRHQRMLRVEYLLADQVLRRQRRVALQVMLGALQLRGILGLHAGGLVERGLQRPRVDLGQEIAFLYQLAFDEADTLQLSVDARGDLRGVESLHVAKPFQVYRHVASRGQRGVHRHRHRAAGRQRGGGRLTRQPYPTNQNQQHSDGAQQHAPMPWTGGCFQ